MTNNDRMASATANPSRVQNTKSRLMRRLTLAVVFSAVSAMSVQPTAQVRPPTAPLPTEIIQPQPDLVVLGTAKCIVAISPLKQETKLTFSIRNQGTGDAPQFSTPQRPRGWAVAWEVLGQNGGYWRYGWWYPKGGIAAGATKTHTVAGDRRCLREDCRFRVTIDDSNHVRESLENNNVVEGLCTRPVVK